MNVSTLFRRECIRIHDGEASKQGILEIVASVVAATGVYAASEETILEAFEEREQAGSTGFEEGVALPHCFLENIDRFVAGLIVVHAGVDFASLDGKPARLVFFVVAPADRKSDHIRVISEISRNAMNSSFRKIILAAGNEDEIERYLTGAFDAEIDGNTDARCLIHLFVQREEPFDELLEIFAAAVPGSLCVLEGANAGSFVERLPLFSTFWTDPGDRFFRVIIAVVSERLQNDLLRRINTIVRDIDDRPGVMVTVQPLSFVSGSLEY